MFSTIINSIKFTLYFLGTAFIIFMVLGISIVATQDYPDKSFKDMMAYLMNMDNLKKIFHDPRTNGAVEHLGNEMGQSLERIQKQAPEVLDTCLKQLEPGIGRPSDQADDSPQPGTGRTKKIDFFATPENGNGIEAQPTSPRDVHQPN